MYSIRQLFNQEPSRITAAVGQILTTIGILGWSPLDDKANLAIIGTLNTILVLIYVAPRVVSAGKLDELNQAQLEAIDLGKQIAPVTHVTNVVQPEMTVPEGLVKEEVDAAVKKAAASIRRSVRRA